MRVTPSWPAARVRPRAVGLALACAASAVRLGAQDSTALGGVRGERLAPGTRLKVAGPALRVGPGAATLVEQRRDTLIVRTADGALAFVPLDGVTRLQVGRGRRPRGEGAKRGALVGLVAAGGATVVASGVAFLSDHGRAPSDCDFLCVPGSVALAVVGTALTGVATLGGAAIGALAPGERWSRVRPSDVRVVLAPRPGGTAVALGFHF